MLVVAAELGHHICWYKVSKKVILRSSNAEARSFVGTSGVQLRISNQSPYKLQYKSEVKFHVTNTVYYLHLVFLHFEIKD